MEKGILADPIQGIVGSVWYDCPVCGSSRKGETRLRIKYIMECVFFCPKCRGVFELRWHRSQKITEQVLREDGWLREEENVKKG